MTPWIFKKNKMVFFNRMISVHRWEHNYRIISFATANGTEEQCGERRLKTVKQHWVDMDMFATSTDSHWEKKVPFDIHKNKQGIWCPNISYCKPSWTMCGVTPKRLKWFWISWIRGIKTNLACLLKASHSLWKISSLFPQHLKFCLSLWFVLFWMNVLCEICHYNFHIPVKGSICMGTLAQCT